MHDEARNTRFGLLSLSIAWMAVFLLIGFVCPAGAQNAKRSLAMPTRYYQVGPNPNAIVAVDLNDNGLPDIVTADRGELHDPREERPANDEVSILFAELPFDYTRRYPSLKTGFGPYALAIANVDGLKWPDIVAVNFLATRHRDVSVFLNLKDEGIFKSLEFRMPDDILTYQRHLDGEGAPLYTVPGLTDAAIHDLDQDGFRDLIAVGWSSDVLVVMPGDREKIFGEPRFTNVPGGPRALALADLTGNGAMDLAVALYASSEVALFQGDGRGGFEMQDRFVSRGALPTTIHVQDMNLDGRADLIVSHSHTDDNIILFYGDEPFSYTLSQELMLGADRNVLEHEIRDVVITDLNQDGRPDIVAACHASASVIVLVNSSKDSAIPQQYQRETYKFNEGRPRALCAADFDKNDQPDIAVALWDMNAVGIMRNVEPPPAR